MGMDPVSWAAIAAVSAAVGTGASIHQGQMQLKSQEHAYNEQRRAEERQRQAAIEEAQAQKRALIAEQESMSSASDGTKKRKTTEQAKSAFSASGKGWALGEKDEKLGG